MKVLKWFSLECGNWSTVILDAENIVGLDFESTEEAFTWLENNGYIERI